MIAQHIHQTFIYIRALDKSGIVPICPDQTTAKKL